MISPDALFLNLLFGDLKPSLSQCGIRSILASLVSVMLELELYGKNSV